jgi:signal-transduction protein with cAMP-binding, CBS, and nucleotidyltransferase domain
MINVKWNFEKPMSDYTPFEVPKDIIDVKKSSTLYPLNNFIRVVDKPFGI